MLVDCKYDKYKYLIRRQGLANRLREKWKIINGESPVISSIDSKLEEG